MKIDTIEFVLNSNKYLDKNFYLVSGNETSLIEKVKDTLVAGFKNKFNCSINRQKKLGRDDKKTDNLFHDKELVLVSDLGDLDEGYLEAFKNENVIYVFILPNSPKINTFKRKTINNKNIYLLDCYSLTKEMKIKILNFYCKSNDVSFSEETFWYLIEDLDERYMFLESELDKIFLMRDNLLTVKHIKSVLTRSISEGDKIFFNVYKDNDFIVNKYRESILDQSDLNTFFYTIKNNIFLIIYNDSLVDFEKKIPRYLFREKSIYLKIYKNIDIGKKGKLTDLIYFTEKNLRKHSELNLLIGLRFFLNLKKIIIS